MKKLIVHLIICLLLLKAFGAQNNFKYCNYRWMKNRRLLTECSPLSPSTCQYQFRGIPTTGDYCYACSSLMMYAYSIGTCEGRIKQCLRNGPGCGVKINSSMFCAFEDGKPAREFRAYSTLMSYGWENISVMDGPCPKTPQKPSNQIKQIKQCYWHKENSCIKSMACIFKTNGIPQSIIDCLACHQPDVYAYGNRDCGQFIKLCDNKKQQCAQSFRDSTYCTFSRQQPPLTLPKSVQFNQQYSYVMSGACPVNPFKESIGYCSNLVIKHFAPAYGPTYCGFKAIGLPRSSCTGCECRLGIPVWMRLSCDSILVNCKGNETNCGQLINSTVFCAFEEGKAPITLNEEPPNPNRTYTKVLARRCPNTWNPPELPQTQGRQQYIHPFLMFPQQQTPKGSIQNKKTQQTSLSGKKLLPYQRVQQTSQISGKGPVQYQKGQKQTPSKSPTSNQRTQQTSQLSAKKILPNQKTQQTSQTRTSPVPYQRTQQKSSMNNSAQYRKTQQTSQKSQIFGKSPTSYQKSQQLKSQASRKSPFQLQKTQQTSPMLKKSPAQYQYFQKSPQIRANPAQYQNKQQKQQKTPQTSRQSPLIAVPQAMSGVRYQK